MRPWSILLSFLTPSSHNIVHNQRGQPEEEEDSPSAYDIWLASRAISKQSKELLVPGAQRPLTVKNARLAYLIILNNAAGLVSWTSSAH